MSIWSEKAAQEYPGDLITAEDFPDSCPPEHPLPWLISEAGNGHYRCYDCNGIKFAHVYCYSGPEMKLLEEKVWRIYAAHKDELSLIDAKELLLESFDQTQHPLPWRIASAGMCLASLMDGSGECISMLYFRTEADFMDVEEALLELNGEEDQLS